MSRAGVVLPAAGQGTRLGGRRKPFLELAGKPVLWHALQPFLRHAGVEVVAIALPPAEAASPPPWLTTLDARIRLVPGGSERGDSVRAALSALPVELDVVVVHDAARPLVSDELVDRAISAAAAGLAVVVAVPVSDTIKEVDPDRRIVGSPDRTRLWAAQTPQAFPAALLRSAYEQAAREGVTATDDAALVARYGGTVVILEGDVRNLKITTEADLVVAAALLRS